MTEALVKLLTFEKIVASQKGSLSCEKLSEGLKKRSYYKKSYFCYQQVKKNIEESCENFK